MMRIQRLTRDDKEELISVLMAAFHEYPVMRFVLRTKGEEYEHHLKQLISFYSELRFQRNWPVRGIRADDKLVAVALVNEPVPKLLPLPEKLLSELRSAIGDSAYSRLELYEQKSSEGEHKKPHHFLGMIGVLPEYQGKGYAAALLNDVKDMSVADLTSAGVCLSTESSGNVALYERFGYRVISETDIEELHSWFMFLPSR